MELRKEQILGGKIDLQHDFLPTEDHIFSHWCWSFCQKEREMTHKCGRARPIYLFEPTAEKCNFLPFWMTTGSISKLKVFANTLSIWMLYSDLQFYHWYWIYEQNDTKFQRKIWTFDILISFRKYWGFFDTIQTWTFKVYPFSFHLGVFSNVPCTPKCAKTAFKVGKETQIWWTDVSRLIFRPANGSQLGPPLAGKAADYLPF